MVKEITLEWMKKVSACSEACEALELSGLSDPFEVLDRAIEIDRFDWANWMIVRLMNKKQRVQYAIFSAELVIGIFEKAVPEDDRPRKAIEAAKDYLEKPSEETKEATCDAASSAYDAAYAALDAASSVYAAYASSVYAAYAAYAATDDALDAASDAASSAAYAVADPTLKEQIIEYGKLLLKGRK